MSQLQAIIEDAFERRADINPANATNEVKDAVFGVLADLDAGKLRVASRIGDSQDWETHQWLKKPYCSHSAWKTTNCWTMA